jgi:hypothetical protein
MLPAGVLFCLSGAMGEPVLLIISGELLGDSRGLWLGLELDVMFKPEIQQYL